MTASTDAILNRLNLRLTSHASRRKLAIATVSGLAGGPAFILSVGLAAGLSVDLTTALAFGLMGGLVFGLTVWIRYLIGCWLARRKGKLPRRVGRFLDWAYRANLLRMAGTAAQFRHRELQAWLITRTQDHPAQPVQEQDSKTLRHSAAGPS